MKKTAAATTIQIVKEFLDKHWPEAKQAIEAGDWKKAKQHVSTMLAAYFHAAGMNENVLSLMDTDAASSLNWLEKALGERNEDSIALHAKEIDEKAIPEWEAVLKRYAWQDKWQGKAEQLQRLGSQLLSEAYGISNAVGKRVKEKYFSAGPEIAQKLLDRARDIKRKKTWNTNPDGTPKVAKKATPKFSFDKLLASFNSAKLEAVDYFQDADDQALDGPFFNRVRDLVLKKAAEEEELTMPVVSGTRVAFVPTVEALFTYPKPPNSKVAGTVVRVRTANGDMTAVRGLVFVKWDDGSFKPVMKQHLRRASGNVKTASKNSYRIVASGLGDLSAFMKVGGSNDSLVHKATRDLWSLQKTGDQFVLERLFTETGEPLKV